jgi:GT2 family glycosyltransferase
MKKIVIFTVNYKSDDFLIKFLNSIAKAKNNSEDFKLEIHILENSELIKDDLDSLRNKLGSVELDIKLYAEGPNRGYFGGLPIAKNLVDECTDYLIYCNPDLEVDVNFFSELFKLNKDNGGIIAPAIISDSDGFDQNPKYLERLPIKKLLRLKLIYSSIVSFNMFSIMARCKELISGKQTNINSHNISRIYAPHGAMFIFTDTDFFKKIPDYPCLLFGEEIFIAEEAKKNNVDVIYKPEIKVSDVRHASIKFLSSNFKRRLYLESINYILRYYY